MAAKIRDLREAMAFLEAQGQGPEMCDTPLSTRFEIADHYVHQYAGVPASRVSRDEKAVMYRSVRAHSMPVLLGGFGSRRQNRLLLCEGDGDYHKAVLTGIKQRIPVETAANPPPCQEVVITRDIDLCRSLPILTLTRNDAGPYVTMGLVVATDRDSGISNASIHRLCVQNKDELSIAIYPGRHLGILLNRAIESGRPLAVSINIGLDPAIYIASCLTEPLCTFQDSELEIAGGIRGEAVQVSPCRSIDEICISRAEIVLEGVIAGEQVRENQNHPNAGSMPEFTGYQGVVPQGARQPLVKIRAITHRKEAIYQSCIGPGLEQSELQSITPELAIKLFLAREFPQLEVRDVVFNSAGGGVLMGVIQVNKRKKEDDDNAVDAATKAVQLATPFKHILLVDEDIDPFSPQDLWWAMTTRFQADIDTYTSKSERRFTMDPTQSPLYRGLDESPKSTKAVFDCSVPFALKPAFRRAFDPFMGNQKQ
jgi:4-hydroxy-3-polyprenylbenzoate decarboxylase